MAVIDRIQLLSDEKLWLPDGNILTDSQMNSINDYVIANQVPADLDQYYAEALCKGLKAIAQANKVKYQVDGKGIKREKVGDVELERFDGTSETPWKDFIDSLVDLCPIFGYTGLSSGRVGMKISPSDKFTITDEPNISSLVSLDLNTSGDDLTL